MSMMRRYPYFKPCAQSNGPPAPAPLSHTIERTARFEEVDPLSIVWHGRYPSYFEDARVAFGNTYGIGYLDLQRAGIVAPVKQMFIDYAAPLRFGQTCHVTATLHWTEAARINFSYVITDNEGVVLTTGYTVQLFLDAGNAVCIYWPDFYANFCERWKNGAWL